MSIFFFHSFRGFDCKSNSSNLSDHFSPHQINFRSDASSDLLRFFFLPGSELSDRQLTAEVSIDGPSWRSIVEFSVKTSVRRSNAIKSFDIFGSTWGRFESIAGQYWIGHLKAKKAKSSARLTNHSICSDRWRFTRLDRGYRRTNFYDGSFAHQTGFGSIPELIRSLD
jgi:hypothetical protein